MRGGDVQTIVRVGAEGGSITLQGALDEIGCWRFRLVTDERTFADLLPDEFSSEDLFTQGEWATSWKEALAQLDRYPWARLYPLEVHPSLADRTLAAARERLSPGGGRSDPLALSEWRERCGTATAIPTAPATFDGSLAELFTRHIEKVLPAPEVVRGFHQVLVEYCTGPDPLFVVRQVASLERGREVKTRGGRFRPSDNSPAWWVHHLLFSRLGVRNVARMADLLAAMPCHMHDLSRARLRTISDAGWHVAHIVNAKDGDIDYQRWSREELTRRFVRNLHPCNCFYVPKPEWARYGGDSNVLGFAAQVYRDRYGRVWDAFLKMAGSRDLPPPAVPPARVRYVYGEPAGPVVDLEPPTTAATGALRVSFAKPRAEGGVVGYHATRLLFRRSVIDLLPANGVFRVVTRDHGTFQFTRAQFERVFANIIETVSWERDGIYHMARPPKKALPFRIAPPKKTGM